MLGYTKQYIPCHLRLYKQNNRIVSIAAIRNVIRTKFRIIIITLSVVCMDLFEICRSFLFGWSPGHEGDNHHCEECAGIGWGSTPYERISYEQSHTRTRQPL